MNHLFNQQFMNQNLNTETESDSEDSEPVSEYDDVQEASFSNPINNMHFYNQTEDKNYEINLKENTNHIAINSKDRDWISNNKTFDYYVKFNPIGDIYRKQYNIQELENSLINNKITQETYDELSTKYHTIKGQSNNLHLLCDLRNIKEIELTHCIIPNIVINPLDRHQEMINGLNYGSIKTLKDFQYIQVDY